MTEQEEIEEKIRQTAARNGYDLSDNLAKIAKGKLMFFGPKLWVKCPCDPNSDRACISKHCRHDIETDGICHCQLYMKRKQENEDKKASE